jgi:hypothetical protein
MHNWLICHAEDVLASAPLHGGCDDEAQHAQGELVVARQSLKLGNRVSLSLR